MPQDPEFHRQGEARRRHPHLHRAGKHQSGQSARRQEAAEQDHRIPQDAAGLESGRHHDLCRLHPRLSRRHAGIDAARHRDHQEGNAARRARVLLPDAAAGLRGSQDAAQRRASPMDPDLNKYDLEHALHAARPYEQGGVGKTLPRRLGRSITRRSTSRRSCAAPRPTASTSCGWRRSFCGSPNR